MLKQRRTAALLFTVLGTAVLSLSQELRAHAAAVLSAPQLALNDLTSLSLEQLAATQVTSVSKKPERQAAAAAAVYVITAEDIRRAGATSIADALRLAPGVQVERINSSQWSIGVRGFGSRLARSVLVLIDGRSVYSPLFAGTYWEMQDTLLEDIDRIEVIRGPGGTLWGANAVNGVINIITKSSQATQGTYLTAGGGSEERAFGGMRYGGKAGDHLAYRFYGKYFDRNPEFSRNGEDFDDWHMGQAGFRTDWEADPSNSLTVQGDIFDGRQGEDTVVASQTPPFSQALERDGTLFGANILSRWKRQLDNGTDFSLQTYYDRTDRKDVHFVEFRDTYDLDFQHHIPLSSSIHDLIWGADYRFTSNRTESVPTIFFTPTGREDNLAGVFVQDEVSLIERVLTLTLGSKFEHNDYSGWEFQPNSRLAWTPSARQTVWGAVSRAVRTPSATDQDLTLEVPTNPAAPVFTRVMGQGAFQSEKVIAYELGYRTQPVEPVFLDLAAFYNDYSDLTSLEPGTPFTDTTPPGPPRLIIPLTLMNHLKGNTHGLEFDSKWFVTPTWQLRAQYTLLLINLSGDSGSLDTTTAPSSEGGSPRHQVQLESRVDLPHGFEIDPIARFVDNQRGTGSAQALPSYWNLDLHLGWHITKALELALVGQNLLQPHHPEAISTQDIQRAIYGQVSWRSQ